ncbi:CRISPR-associated protein Cas5 2 [Sulfuracidifex tepidarius]|uniref:CRISPR-associated protein Cas5 2 n=1 Tax=Sulfuracidifex tepidarius TaxID=1294262 RepID=A0A510DXM1_9CREN|nr:type I-A CRISPR-associated protein Cas5a [Sulfuracidifex tepidarius]BBG24971.1 CRISPR-associated protein Cas5 2 [Sulfuracidifex tepidarius]
MKGYVFDVEYCWGFQARIAGMSKTSSSYLFPPPSTILGAIAESYNVRKGRSESESVSTVVKLSKEILSLTFKSLNAIPISFQDLNKVIAIRTSAGEEYPSTVEVYKSFDAPARGKTILSSLDDSPPSLRVVLIVRDSDITVDDLWRIKRIGSKESLVSVTNVNEHDVKGVGKEFETDFAIPVLDEVEIHSLGEFLYQFYVPVDGGSLVDSPWKMYVESKTVKYMIGLPFRDYKVAVKVKGKYTGYKVGEEVVMGIES